MVKEKKNKEKKTKSKKGKIWLINTFIALLVIVGLGLIFNKPIRDFMLARNTNRFQVSHYSADQLAKNKKKKANFNFKQVKPVDFSSVVGAQLNTQNLPVIGGIAIPDLGINLPIFNGVESQQLLFGAGTMSESQQMGKGNYSLASHHVFAIAGASQLLFSPLTNAKPGMKIYLTDKNDVYSYTISKVYTVDPNAGYVLEDPKEGQPAIVTLITCTDLDADRRIIVQGTLDKKGKTEFSKTPASITDAFNKQYNQFKP